MLKIQVNSNTTKQMEAILNKIDTFPNRIASAQQSALYRTANNIGQTLYKKYPASKYLDYTIAASGKLGYKMTIAPVRDVKTSGGDDAYIAASVFLKGRRAYTVAGKGRYKMRLRKESVPPFPALIAVASIPRMSGHEDELKREMKEQVIKNLQYALDRFGFGPRGGTTGLIDLPRVRSRVK
jgi:hypothetical protein